MKRGPTPGIRPRRLNPPWMPLDCGVISASSPGAFKLHLEKE
jgi:hypothetical protein